MTYEFCKTSFKECAIKGVWPHRFLLFLEIYQCTSERLKRLRITLNFHVSIDQLIIINIHHPNYHLRKTNHWQTLEVQLLWAANVPLSHNLTHNQCKAVLHCDPLGQTISSGSQRGWNWHRILTGGEDLKEQRKAKSYMCLRWRASGTVWRRLDTTKEQ